MDKPPKHKAMLIIGVLLFTGSLPASYILQKWITPVVCTPPKALTELLKCDNIATQIWTFSLAAFVLAGTGLILWALHIKNNK